jgi:UDP-N-acetyl-D-mannosaminuronic acid dehydrogenase
MADWRNLSRKIRERSCTVGVIGLGYVGLPMAALFASRGFRVLGSDLRREVVEAVNQGRSPIREVGLEDLLAEGVREGRLTATTENREVVRKSDLLLVIVQTPIDERTHRPDLRALKGACRSIAEGDPKGKLIVIESTLPPSTMEGVLLPLLESTGRIGGMDFGLAYSPERAIPTRTLEEIQTNSRNVGGLDETSACLAAELYRQITSGEVFTADLTTVEVVKLIENTYRDVNIALANEIALLCEKLGVDALEAIQMANCHPRVQIHYPGPGVGGHCIPKDPYFLLQRGEELGRDLPLIRTARKINEEMPHHILQKIEEALKGVEKPLEGSKIAVLGIAYKGNTDDVRGTPSRPVIEKLREARCEVFSHDPFVGQDFGGKFSNDLEAVVKGSDCLVVMTDHDCYRNLDMERLAYLMGESKIIVDGRRVIDPTEAEERGFQYYGVGR